MPEQVADEAGHSGSTQVFVDDSGRRSRWVRMAGAGVTTLCAAYVGIVVVGLSQTAVGPLITVPSDGNGLVAGFPDTSGGVPGLLATAGIGPARPVHRAPTPIIRAREVSEAAAARPAKAAVSSSTPGSSGSSRSAGSVADAASVVKGAAAPRSVTAAATAAAPAHRSGSAGDAGRSASAGDAGRSASAGDSGRTRTETTSGTTASASAATA